MAHVIPLFQKDGRRPECFKEENNNPTQVISKLKNANRLCGLFTKLSKYTSKNKTSSKMIVRIINLIRNWQGASHIPAPFKQFVYLFL